MRPGRVSLPLAAPNPLLALSSRVCVCVCAPVLVSCHRLTPLPFLLLLISFNSSWLRLTPVAFALCVCLFVFAVRMLRALSLLLFSTLLFFAEGVARMVQSLPRLVRLWWGQGMNKSKTRHVCAGRCEVVPACGRTTRLAPLTLRGGCGRVNKEKRRAYRFTFTPRRGCRAVTAPSCLSQPCPSRFYAAHTSPLTFPSASSTHSSCLAPPGRQTPFQA